MPFPQETGEEEEDGEEGGTDTFESALVNGAFIAGVVRYGEEGMAPVAVLNVEVGVD